MQTRNGACHCVNDLVKQIHIYHTRIAYENICHIGPIALLHICDDDDEGRINFSVALSPKTTRTRNNKLKQ